MSMWPKENCPEDSHGAKQTEHGSFWQVTWACCWGVGYNNSETTQFRITSC